MNKSHIIKVMIEQMKKQYKTLTLKENFNYTKSSSFLYKDQDTNLKIDECLVINKEGLMKKTFKGLIYLPYNIVKGVGSLPKNIVKGVGSIVKNVKTGCSTGCSKNPNKVKENLAYILYN
jgi:hypothetical protein